MLLQNRIGCWQTRLVTAEFVDQPRIIFLITLFVVAVLASVTSLALGDAPLRLSFDEMARTPQQYFMKQVRVHGRVIEIQDANNEVTIQVNISTNELDFRENILILYSRSRSEPRLFDGDVVDVRGVFRGLITYTSVLGVQLNMPAVTAEELIRQETT